MKKLKYCFLINFLIIDILFLYAVNAATISEEARKYFLRGLAAVEMAKTTDDYEDAISEFEKAKSLAPNWPEVYYHLALAQEKAQRYNGAIQSLNQYLRLTPKADNADEMKILIYKLEYKKEKEEKETNIKNILKGEWVANHSPRRGFQEWPVQFIIEEDSIYLYAPMIDYQQISFTGYKKIPVKRNNDDINFMVIWEQSIRGFKNTSKEEIKFNLTIADSRTLEGTITYTPKEGWSYSQRTQKVVFRKK